jgi:hypothetical protein
MSTSGQMTTLVTFNAANGPSPITRLLLTADGSFYGATAARIFRVTSKGELTVLAPFTGTNTPGARASALIQSREGPLYGVANAAASITSTATSPFVYRYVEPPVINVTPAAGTGFALSWNSFNGAVYGVQYKSNADDLSWTSFPTNVTSTGTSASFYDDASGTYQRFYQVILLP